MALQYHIKLNEKNTAKYAILPGDPGRVPVIASLLESPRHVMTNREFCTYEGFIDSEKVLVISTGIGSASAAICAEELHRIGVEYIIRVGTCGGMQKGVHPADVIIASGAIRMEGTSKEYMPIEFPAVADFGVTSALKEAAERLGYPHHVGVVQSKDSFYGQHDPDSMAAADELKFKWNAWKKGGCLASEMESSALFIVGALRRMKAGACFHTVWNQESDDIDMGGQVPSDDMTATLNTAIEALRILIEKSR